MSGVAKKIAADVMLQGDAALNEIRASEDDEVGASKIDQTKSPISLEVPVLKAASSDGSSQAGTCATPNASTPKKEPQSTSSQSSTHSPASRSCGNIPNVHLDTNTNMVERSSADNELQHGTNAVTVTVAAASGDMCAPTTWKLEACDDRKTPEPLSTSRVEGLSPSCQKTPEKMDGQNMPRSFPNIPRVPSTGDCIASRKTPDVQSLGKTSELTVPKKIPEVSSTGSLSDAPKSSKSDQKSDKKKKTWYNVLNPTYKSRSEDFKKLFKDLPDTERLLVDYSCALQKDILVHGRLYMSQSWLCFYANIFRWETVLTIRIKDIQSITKEKTARVIPNALQVSTPGEKYFFTSFGARDKAFLMIFRVWQNVLMDQPMSSQELWQWVHQSYGDELGLTSDDDDYVPPPSIENENLGSWDNKLESLEESESAPNLYSSYQASPSDDYISAENNMNNNSMDVSEKKRRQLPRNLDSNSFSSGSESEDEDDDDTDDESPQQLTEAARVNVGLDKHEGQIVIDQVYGISVDQMFCNLFSDSPFFRAFTVKRKMENLSVAAWFDEDDGSKRREVSYTMTVSTSLGTKVTSTTESQMVYGNSRAGKVYIVLAEVVSSGFPYCDVFYIVNNYCITKVSPKDCHLLVACRVVYRKQPWGLVKSLIEKNAFQGAAEHFSCLDDCLQKEAIKLEKNWGKRSVIFTDQNIGDVAGSESIATLPARVSRIKSFSHGVQEAKEAVIHGLGSSDVLVKVILVILLMLLCVNAMLYYQLRYIEMRERRRIDLSSLPTSDAEWGKVLDRQNQLHELEVKRWKEIIDMTVQMVDKMQVSLKELKKAYEIVTNT